MSVGVAIATPLLVSTAVLAIASGAAHAVVAPGIGVAQVVTNAPSAERNDVRYADVIPGTFDTSGRPGVMVIGAQLIDTAVLTANGSGGYSAAASSGVNTGDTGFGFGASFTRGGDYFAHGDFNGDGLTDVVEMFTGSTGGGFLVSFSTGHGGFNSVTASVPGFGPWLGTHGAVPIVGDFNGDGKADIALVGGSGWTTVPVAFSNGDGAFTVTNQSVASFPGWASGANVHAVAGDFNHDGRTDIALVGGSGWTTVPVAFSNGDGTFNVTNASSPSLAGWASTSGSQVVAGDFNGDGKTDLAVVNHNPSAGWTTVPLGFSNGDGTFLVTNATVPTFPGWASSATVTVVTGDFDGDGRTDMALLNSDVTSGWFTIPTAFSNGDGTFRVTNAAVPNFPSWADDPDARVFVEDLNGDGKTDIALAGGSIWTTIPTALSNGDGTYTVSNPAGGSLALDARYDGTDGSAPSPTPTSTSSSSPTPTQVRSYTVENCDDHPVGTGNSFGPPKSVWVDDVTAGTGFHESAILSGYPVGELCGSGGNSTPDKFVLNAAAGHTYELRVIDFGIAPNCTTDSPTGCEVLDVTVQGNVGGQNIVTPVFS